MHPFTLVFGAIVIFGLLYAGYHIARRMKGSIKLSLPKTTFNAGETITGSFELNAKKAIEGNKLIVILIGSVTSEVSRDNGGTRNSSCGFYYDTQVIEEARSYESGYTANHDFKLVVPDQLDHDAVSSAKLKTKHSGRRRGLSWLTWKVQARLDAKGVDLADSIDVDINIDVPSTALL